MDDLRERLVAALVASLPPMLEPWRGQDLYVLALTTDSDIITVRLAAHTDEQWRALSGGEDDAEIVRLYRWWPDEWAVEDDVAVPPGAETTGDICDAMYAGCRDQPIDVWRAAAWRMLVDALGDPRVLATVQAIEPAWHPVRFVTDTDGDNRPAAQSILTLNAGHPRPALVAEAHAFFLEEEAEGP